MAYEKLSRRALGCMYTAEIIGDVIFIVLIGIVNIFWLIPKQIEIGRWISAVLLIYAAVSMLVEPYFRYNRYRYSINEECIDIREGYLFVKRNIVPIERLHKLEISKGPIDQIFHVAKVTVTTAGGDVTLRFLEEEKAEKARVMEIVLKDACSVPMEIMEKCCEAIELIVEFGAKGSKLAISDAGVGAAFCKAALKGASLNVYINTKSMADREYAEELNKKADAMLEKYTKIADETFDSVLARLK